MQKGDPKEKFPNGNPTYAQSLLGSRFSLSGGDEMPYAFATDAILDTGAPTTNIDAASDIMIPKDYLESETEANTRIAQGNIWNVTAEGTQVDTGFSLSLITGETPGINEITVSKDPDKTRSELNLGLIRAFGTTHDIRY